MRQWSYGLELRRSTHFRHSKERVAVECRSLTDFAKTIIRFRRRFNEELKKMAAREFPCVIVEESMRDVLAKPPRMSRASTSRLAPLLRCLPKVRDILWIAIRHPNPVTLWCPFDFVANVRPQIGKPHMPFQQMIWLSQ